MAIVAWIVALLLGAFTLRRFVYLAASLLPSPPQQPSRRFSIAILAAVKDEETTLPDLLRALSALDYPQAQLTFTLISDGSTDATAKQLEQWCAVHPNARTIASSLSHGKAEALNQALRAAPSSDLIAVYDADTRPAPTHLAMLAGAFEDPRVAAASGLLVPCNAARSMVSCYAALETWVYQMVILAGKERCGTNPPVVGSNCLYRRKDLEALGGFPPGSLSEDIELSLALGKRGRRTRWVRAARARAHVAGTLGHFWRQRTRWTSGMYHSRREVRGLEGLFTVNGYADRLIFVAAVGLAWWGILHPIWIALYLAAPLAAMLIALARAEDPGPRWLYLFVTPLMFAVDVAASITATVLHLLGHRAEWRTDRA